MRKKQKECEDKIVATCIKPSVFEVKTTSDKKDELYKKLNTPRLTKDFIRECMDVSKQLRKKNNK